MNALEALRVLARGRVHAGYRWAMLAADGAIVCETCTRENYRQTFRATREPGTNQQWECVALVNSGEHDSESDECCAHCGKVVFDGMPADTGAPA